MVSQAYDINRALMDPKGVFGSPERVVSDPRLDRQTKLDILRKWRHDAYALSTAEYEGMEGDGSSMLHRVQQSIERVTGDTDS